MHHFNVGIFPQEIIELYGMFVSRYDVIAADGYNYVWQEYPEYAEAFISMIDKPYDFDIINNRIDANNPFNDRYSRNVDNLRSTYNETIGDICLSNLLGIGG